MLSSPASFIKEETTITTMDCYRNEERKTTVVTCLLILGLTCLVVLPSFQITHPEEKVEVRYKFSSFVRVQAKPQNHGRMMFVHVGKTGGSTVEQFLKANEIRFFMVHQKPLGFQTCRSTGYSRLSSCTSWAKRWRKNLRVVVVSVRDPLKRLVSAFNWRNPNGGGVTHNKYVRKYWPEVDRFEKELYECFDSINELAESLDLDTPCGKHARKAVMFRPTFYGTHMTQGYEFYFGSGVLESLVRNNITLYLVHQETMAQDLEGIQKLIAKPLIQHSVLRERSTYAKKNDTLISNDGLRKLAPFLQSEYDMLAKLESVSVNGLLPG